MGEVLIFIRGLSNTHPVRLLDSFMRTQEAILLAYCGPMAAMAPSPLLQDSAMLGESSIKDEFVSSS